MPAICWRCGKPLKISPSTGTCIYCSYGPDENLEKLIRVKKAIHDLKESNPQSSGNDPDYRVKKRWSMRD